MREIQNINLLESLSIKPPSKLTALYLFKIIGLFYLLFLFISSIFWAYTMQKKMVLSSLRNEKIALEKIVKKRFARSLGIGDEKNYSRGFSSFLLALADITPDGIWLKNITFAEHNNMIFVGETVNASLITDFIGALNKDPVINGVFDTFAINKFPIDAKKNERKALDGNSNDLINDQAVISFSLGAIVESDAKAKKS